MKTSEINFKVQLDDKNVPEKITWDATDKPQDGPEKTKAIALAIWDDSVKNTLRMDLWDKEMSVEEMKKFVVDSIGGLATTVRSATADDKMADMMEELCRNLVKHVKEEHGM